MKRDQKRDSDSQTRNGKPWDVVGKFSDFTGADILRSGILLENADELEVKVKKMSDGYVVKTRRLKEEESSGNKEKRTRKRTRKDRKGK